MSGPFQVGDVVERVSGSPAIPRGTILRVGGIHPSRYGCSCGCQGLLFDERPNGPGFAAWQGHNFRHVFAADEQFTAQIHACRPIKVEQPV